MKLRVLHLLAPAPFGGAETMVRHLARAQAQAGAEVHVAAILDPDSADGHPFVETVRTTGLAVHVLEVPERRYWLERKEVDRLLSVLAPEILHTHGYRADVLDAPMARAADVATVTTAHGFTGNDLKNRLYEWAQRRAFRSFDAVLAVSADLVRRLVESGVPRELVHLVPNAWVPDDPPVGQAEARRTLDLPRSGPPLVGWVGRVGPEKGPDLMIRALADPLLEEAHLCMVGSGPALAACETLSTELGVSDRIHWAGSVPGAGRLMRAFDTLCLSSRTEGTPMVLFEANWANIPVVATAVGGVPDLLGDGWNLVTPDDVHVLAEALGKAIRDPEARLEAQTRLRRRINRKFDPSTWAERHLELYRALTLDLSPRASAGIGGA